MRFSRFLMIFEPSFLPQASRYACHQHQPLVHPYHVEHNTLAHVMYHLICLGWGGANQNPHHKQSDSLSDRRTHTQISACFDSEQTLPKDYYC